MDIPIGSVFISRNLKEDDNSSPGFWNHVSIYIGDNSIVEAYGEQLGVIQTSLDEYKQRDYEYFVRYPKNKEIGKRAAIQAVKLIGSPYRYISSIFRRMRRDEKGESCVSVIRKAYYRASGYDPKHWKIPDSLAGDTIFLTDILN